ncbi:glycosyltransferase [Marinobacterium sp. YM272]|uniref:glycosyltransferase n=1 Tax=Marinobacterium sp. YM272 TaxID=3421654 RepID=UPI003D7FD2AE
MKISIAMAVYNGQNYIENQLESFLDQTVLPDELVITDDCSSDQTEEIVKKFSEAAPFDVLLFRNSRRLGYCGNFNAALTKTTGDLVFLSDQDDVWFPDKIEYMLNVAENNPDALLMMNNALLTDKTLNHNGLTKIGQIRSAGFDMRSFVMGCCCVVRRELLDLSTPIPEGVEAHDKWLVWFADGLNAKIVDEKILQYYRRHETNESQFIVNKITKVNRLEALIHLSRNALKSNSQKDLRSQLTQLKLFCNAINNSLRIAPERHIERLETLERIYRQRVVSTKKRLEIIDKPLLTRFLAVGALILCGHYRYANGLRSAIRDILG